MELTVTELIDLLQKYKTEIGCDGNNIASHASKSSVRFMITNPEVDLSLELQDVELDLRIGCYCPQGITFLLRAEKD
jgi:hypothetical protein